MKGFSQKVTKLQKISLCMTLQKINPTKTLAWSKLENHFLEVKDLHLRSLVENQKYRKSAYSINFNDFTFNYSNNRINDETLNLLLELANEVNVKKSIEALFSGEQVNQTENRPALHTALRTQQKDEICVAGKNILIEVAQALQSIEDITKKITSGFWKGYTGKPIETIVNIGIGGSHLGPDMVVNALKYYKNHLDVKFISNIDGDELEELIKQINSETTLFIVVSKTFTTKETLTNANSIKKWFLKHGSEKDLSKHFLAVSSNSKGAIEFGISPEHILPMWDWVGGRFSLWSAVGLSISLAIGFDHFQQLLVGGDEMDTHFRTAPLAQNAPVIASLISVWYSNFFNSETEVVLPYTHYLEKLPSYLQQLCMESNGKTIDNEGNLVNYQTGNIVWGSAGTNAQHAFMQLLHQGTKLIPADFIGFKKPLHGNHEHHEQLMANFEAQMEALAVGKTKQEVHLDMKLKQDFDEIAKLLPHKVFEGNKPSNKILMNQLTPKSLGSLVAFYEHKVFVQGVIWNINSFDQFGVELGKELANRSKKINF
jgi:glucose-6-phosphate isomerase